jgi:hypothetical protein
MWYYDLAKTLSGLSFSDIWNWLNNIWDKISNPYNTINLFVWEMLEFKYKIAQAYEWIKWLWIYEYSYWWWYVWTTLWFMVWDPGWKLKSLVWWGNISKIWEKTLETIWKLKDAYKLKVIARFKNINWIDDILKIASDLNITAWSWWGAMLIYWNSNTSDAIIDVLKSKGWKEYSTNKPWVFNYKSLDWKEVINMRNTAKSIIEWYNTNITFDLLKYDEFWRKLSERELKFVLPKK